MSQLVDHAGDVATAAKLFRGFSDPTRLGIVMLLTDGERRVTDLVVALDGSQGNISGHLKCLKDCGLVTDRRAGREVFYRLACDEVFDLLRAAERLVATTGQPIKLCPNYATGAR